MYAIDVVELSATISEKITRANPLVVNVKKVINKNTFETAFASSLVQPEDFWHDDHNHQILTADEKARRHLQFHRSVGCNSFVLAFVTALKKLCNSGIPLHYEGRQVVDIWVMNTTEFDISDIPENRILQLRDPISGVTIPALSTYENQDRLRQIGKDVCLRFGYHVPPECATGKALQKRKVKSYKTAVPHWWVAVLVEGNQGGDKERLMVHLDVCGAAYDDTGFRNHEGALVSLQVFTTPEYNLFPSKMLGKNISGEDLSHKFVMTSATNGPGNQTFSSLQPLSIRHLRCFHWKDHAGVEVTPVDTFIDRNIRGFLGSYDDWSETVSELRHDFMIRAPVGTELIVCNLSKRPDLNEKKAVVHACVSTELLTDRLPVWVDGVGNPLKIKTNCLRFSTSKAYSSFNTLLRRVELLNKVAAELPIKPLSMKDQAKLKKSLAADPELSEALGKLMTGKMTISFFADPKFVKGMRTLSAPPFDVLLTPPLISTIRDGLEIADHPESREAFKILKLCKSAKLKAVQQNPSIIRGGGALAIDDSSDFYRLMHSISQKIKSSSGLTQLFEMMDRKGLFPNPTRQIR